MGHQCNVNYEKGGYTTLQPHELHLLKFSPKNRSWLGMGCKTEQNRCDDQKEFKMNDLLLKLKFYILR